MAALIIFGLIFIGLAIVPSLWVQSVIARHGQDRTDFPGTGSEFARHILDEMKLTRIRVEETQLGDHYDPQEKVVRLLPQHFNGRSLSAVVIAAHEVGHAMQDATNYAPLKARQAMAKYAHLIQNAAILILMLTPVLMIIVRSPAIFIIQIAGALMLIGITVLLHATTLPVEFDASFKRAMPVLQAGRYLPERDMPAARQILRAAAYTYVAAAALSLLDITRWLRLLRF